MTVQGLIDLLQMVSDKSLEVLADDERTMSIENVEVLRVGYYQGRVLGVLHPELSDERQYKDIHEAVVLR